MNDGQPATPAPNSPGSAAPGQPPSAPPQPPPKSNKTLIIILVVVFLLLCSCCVVVGGGLAFYASIEPEAEPVAEEPGEPMPTPEDSLDATALAEWNAWVPAVGAYELASPDSRQVTLADEFMAQAHPDFTLDELFVDNGGYDESDGSFMPDLYVVRAHMTGSPTIEIVDYCQVPNVEGVKAGVAGIDRSSLSERSIVGTLSSGVEYIRNDSAQAIYGGVPADIEAVLLKAAGNWPGGVVTAVWHAEDGSDAVEVAVTRWEHYHTSEEFEGVWANYVPRDGEWVLREYELTLSE